MELSSYRLCFSLNENLCDVTVVYLCNNKKKKSPSLCPWSVEHQCVFNMHRVFWIIAPIPLNVLVGDKLFIFILSILPTIIPEHTLTQ